MKIRFKKLSTNAVIPTRAHESDAGFDLTATYCTSDLDGCVVYRTGIAVEIPKGYVGLIFPRSSIANRNLILTNSVGVIDSGYRGEILAKFRYVNDDFINIPPYKVGDRIGQLVIMPIPEIEFEEVDELSDSDRGTGGYGSTGD